jgi:hypothetical protein
MLPRLASAATVFLIVAAMPALGAPQHQQSDQTRPAQDYPATSDQLAERPIMRSTQAADNLQPKATEKAKKDAGQEESTIEKAWRHWIRRFLTDLKITDVLVALFTGLLALYTARLWIATHNLQEVAEQQRLEMARSITAAEKTADAALSQARTLIAMESPVFAWLGVALEVVDTALAFTGIVANTRYRPVIIVKNVGRTHMESREFCVETTPVYGFRADLSNTPTYTESGIIKAAYLAEANMDVRLRHPDRILTFTADQVSGLDSGEMKFFVYGFVKYFNPLAREAGDAGFIAMWNRNGFINFGLPNYNYHRREKVNGDGSLP